MTQNELYRAFLREFPLEKLKELPIEHYTNFENNSFCYWLEVKLEGLGGIRGSISYKFGIFKFRKKPALNNVRYQTDDEYAWCSRLGDNHSEAYSRIITEVSKIAELANECKFDDIEGENGVLYNIVKWKIAFLYSNEKLLPIYKKDMLEELAAYYGMDNPENASQAELNTYILSQKGDKDLFEFYDELLEIRKRKSCGIIPYPDYVPKLEKVFADENTGNYWFLVANPNIWSLSSLGTGEETDYTLYNENGNPRRIFKNFQEAKAGDLIVGYESGSIRKVTALGEISKGIEETDGKRIYFRKTHSLPVPIDYNEMQNQPELYSMEFFKNSQGSLFKLTKVEYDALMSMILERNPVAKSADNEEYTKTDFLSEVYMNESDYDRLVALLKYKKNIILQGAPGVGKTFTAKRLAYSLMGVKDESRISFVQFHQNYSYEDFVMGYKPNASGGFELRNGVFYDACIQAENNPEKDYFFIIDEINRGNLSKIFGELLMLIENSYRSKEKVKLAYSGELFSVPENLYIVGMMNTADRSLAMIDYALRRRFSFFEMNPGFDTKGFKNYQNSLKNETFNKVIDGIRALNSVIANDNSLGAGFCIGHSYFCNSTDNNRLKSAGDMNEHWLQNVIDFDIAPMLHEYWFDDKTQADTQIKKLKDLLK